MDVSNKHGRFQRSAECNQISHVVWGQVLLSTQTQLTSICGLYDRVVMKQQRLQEKLHLIWSQTICSRTLWSLTRPITRSSSSSLLFIIANILCADILFYLIPCFKGDFFGRCSFWRHGLGHRYWGTRLRSKNHTKERHNDAIAERRVFLRVSVVQSPR